MLLVGLPFQEDREADQQPDDHEELGECPETSSHPTCPTSQPQNLSLTGISNTVPPETAMSPPLRRPASAMSPPLSAMSPVSTIPDISAREMYTAEPPYCESPVVSMATAPPPSECVSMVTESGCVSMVTAAGDGGDDTEDDACTIRDEEVSEGSVKGKMVAVPHDGESHLEENTANLEAEIFLFGACEFKGGLARKLKAAHTEVKIKIKILILTAHTPAAVKIYLSHSTISRASLTAMGREILTALVCAPLKSKF
eukprot:sb/3468560/